VDGLSATEDVLAAEEEEEEEETVVEVTLDTVAGCRPRGLRAGVDSLAPGAGAPDELMVPARNGMHWRSAITKGCCDENKNVSTTGEPGWAFLAKHTS
jgi:hypothetical protein